MSDTAQRLADALSTDYYDDVRVTAAVNELRRLHAENEALKVDLWDERRQRDIASGANELVKMRRDELEALNAELVDALREIEWSNDTTWQRDRAKAALAKAGVGNG